jgi:hypothetical protein
VEGETLATETTTSDFVFENEVLYTDLFLPFFLFLSPPSPSLELELESLCARV